MPGGLWPKIGSDAHVATAIRGAAIVLGAYIVVNDLLPTGLVVAMQDVEGVAWAAHDDVVEIR